MGNSLTETNPIRKECGEVYLVLDGYGWEEYFGKELNETRVIDYYLGKQSNKEIADEPKASYIMTELLHDVLINDYLINFDEHHNQLNPLNYKIVARTDLKYSDSKRKITIYHTNVFRLIHVPTDSIIAEIDIEHNAPFISEDHMMGKIMHTETRFKHPMIYIGDLVHSATSA